jgi:hypothetical protein
MLVLGKGKAGPFLCLMRRSEGEAGQRIHLVPGLEKPGFLKKTSPVGFLVFFGFFGFFVFCCFFWFFLYIRPEERVFRVFSVPRILLDASRL